MAHGLISLANGNVTTIIITFFLFIYLFLGVALYISKCLLTFNESNNFATFSLFVHVVD